MGANTHHATSPIHILVDDVLEMIFFQLTLQAHNIESLTLDLPSSSCGGKAPAFSQVCRRWRSVALASPRLWRIILNTGPAFVRELISRSAAMPLVICLQGRMLAPAALEILTLLRPHVPRIQVFLMHLPDDLDDEPLANFVELLLFAGAQLKNMGLSSPSMLFNLPLLSQIQAPMLKTFLLRNVFIPWEYANFAGLTSLTLTFEAEPPPIAQLFRILSKCSSLGQLSISFSDHIPYDFFMTHDELLSLPRVELPRLRSCKLVVLEHLEATYILAHLDLPDSANLRIVISKVDCNYRFVGLVPPHDCPFLQRGLGTSTHATIYGWKPLRHPDRANTWIHFKTVECNNMSTGRNVNLGWTWSSATSGMFHSQPVVFRTDVFPTLQTLTVGKTFLSSEEWRHWLANVPGLRELVVMPTGLDRLGNDAWHLQELLGVLMLNVEYSPVMWPHLRTLAVSAMAFKFAPLRGLVDTLEACCILRAKHGAPITSLVVLYQHGEHTLDDHSLMVLGRIAPVKSVVLPSDREVDWMRWLR